MTGERGLTLVEMLVVLVITGFIGVATGGAFLVFMTTNEGSQDDQAIARDQFWLNSWFLADAQSAEAWGDGSGESCPNVPPDAPDTSQPVAWLHWGDEGGDPPTPEYHVNYRAERASTEEPWQLVRYFCESGEPASRAVVVHSLSLSPAPSIGEQNGRLTFELTSAVDDATVLEATGGRHVGP